MTRRGLVAAAAAVLGAGWAERARAFAEIGGARRVARGLAYGPGARRRMDVYAPGGAGPHPVLVVFDRPAGRGRLALGMARRGFVAVAPDYPETDGFPDAASDAAQATAQAARVVGGHGGDPSRLGVLGQGEGAYAALMIALDRRYMAAAGRPGLIRAAAGLAGVYDPPRPDPTETRPAAYARRDAPPIRLETEGAEADGLIERLRTAGAGLETVRYRAEDTAKLAAFLHRRLGEADT